jgi:hypothetical protein
MFKLYKYREAFIAYWGIYPYTIKIAFILQKNVVFLRRKIPTGLCSVAKEFPDKGIASRKYTTMSTHNYTIIKSTI